MVIEIVHELTKKIKKFPFNLTQLGVHGMEGKDYVWWETEIRMYCARWGDFITVCSTRSECIERMLEVTKEIWK